MTTYTVAFMKVVSAWWREKIAAIRQEHIFVKILFAITVFFFLCGVFFLSFMLLGMHHPMACPLQDECPYAPFNELLRSATIALFATDCFAGKDGIESFAMRYIAPLIDAPIYLIIIYILNKVTGYNKITLLNCVAVYFLYSIAVLIVTSVGGVLFAYVLLNVVPSIGKILSLKNLVLCHWDYNLVAVWLLTLFLLIFCCFCIVRYIHRHNTFVYKCIYVSMAMLWYISIGLLIRATLILFHLPGHLWSLIGEL